MRPTLKVKVPLPSTILLFFALVVVFAFPNVRGVRGLLFSGLGAYLLFMMFVNRGPIRWIHILWVLGFYVLSILSRQWSAYPVGAEMVISNVTYALILNWSVGEYVFQGKRSIGHMCATMAILSILMSVNFLMNSTVEGGRYSLGINANAMGLNSAYLFGMLLYGAKEAHWKKWHLNILSIAMAVIAVLSGSRKSLMMLLLFGFFYVFFWRPEKNMSKFIGRLIGAIVVCVVILVLLMKVEVLYNSIGNRIESLYLQWVQGEEVDASAISREKMIEIGTKLFKMEPLLGFGHNAFKWVTRYTYFTYSHNNYIEILCSLGICGLLIFYVPLVYFFIESFRLWRRGVPGAVLPLAIFVIQFINDVGHVSYYSFQIHIFLGLAVGYVYLMKKEYRQGKYDNVLIDRRK